MDILFKSVTVIDPSSPYHLQKKNLHLQNGIITAITDAVPAAHTLVDEEGLCVSGGWLDMQAWVGEPGLEHKEDLNSAAQAAAKGGFTEVACLPNVEPIVQTRNGVAYLQQMGAALPVAFHAIAAATTDCAGKDLTEMIDLHTAGAVAFSDGKKPLQQAEVVVKALQYLQFFDGLLINRPEHSRMAELGQMHEGTASTLLGMKGIPHLVEEIMVSRDIQLLEYTGGRMHFSQLSSARSVQLVREAKQRGLQITCDVATHQLAFTDETIVPFDTNFKVNPPYRTEEDRLALLQGLQDGTIDVLVSAHTPQDTEAKDLEFDLAEFGIINLETAFAVANTVLQDVLDVSALVQKMVEAPRNILRLPVPQVKEGAKANLTFFHPEKAWIPAEHTTASKSKNSPFYGRTLKGQVFGIVNKNQYIHNPDFEQRGY